MMLCSFLCGRGDSFFVSDSRIENVSSGCITQEHGCAAVVFCGGWGCAPKFAKRKVWLHCFWLHCPLDLSTCAAKPRCVTPVHIAQLQNVAALFGGALLGQYAMFNATGTSVSGNRAIYGGWCSAAVSDRTRLWLVWGVKTPSGVSGEHPPRFAALLPLPLPRTARLPAHATSPLAGCQSPLQAAAAASK